MAAPKKQRADELAVGQGLAQTRSQAQALIMAGQVVRGDEVVAKAGAMYPAGTLLALKDGGRRYVSRGGYKLEGALDDLALNVAGLSALDVGASTGGFTDCLLKRGAASVTAVDVGQGLLDWSLRQDGRVTVVEGVNARRLTESVGGAFDMAVVDVSFISLELVLPQVAALVAPGGFMLPMVKPQFEVGRGKVGKNGVVRQQADIDAAVDKVRDCAAALAPPWREAGRAPSRLAGPKGNREVFLLLRRKK